MENRTDKQLEDDFYETSLLMEPRNCKQLPKFVSKIKLDSVFPFGNDKHVKESRKRRDPRSSEWLPLGFIF